jgi:dihydrofolate reductase
MQISLIAAMAKNRVIGKNNKLPWHLSADLKRFKALTMHKPIVMGRKTYDSIGRPLPGRDSIVLTRNTQLQIDGVDIVHSVQDVLTLCHEKPEIMIIGGSHVYQAFLGHFCLCLSPHEPTQA